ncbi:GPI ethanolamine phosphate transferase 2 [Pelomyxa schiedti]|nr:GPI ethanolamine phosphate transferase 2 [Pelomyxa schiedti]
MHSSAPRRQVPRPRLYADTIRACVRRAISTINGTSGGIGDSVVNSNIGSSVGAVKYAPTRWWLFGVACLAVVVAAQCLGLAHFVRGFFPSLSTFALNPQPACGGDDPAMCAATQQFSSGSYEMQMNQNEPAFDRMVFMVVDALRSDFLFNPKSKMSFTHSLISSGNGYSYVAHAQPPTVTMPRLKALTGGVVPMFMDVLLNLDSPSMTSPNWVNELAARHKKVLFYGDDTWLRLFPGTFTRSEGTTSFFVTDYKTVDDNVTRNVVSELSHDDWDVMILHYLGVDHIGHLQGPNSPLMGPKLMEMDDVVKTIYEAITEQDKLHCNASKCPHTLLVLVSDHGMNEIGNHGGTSLGEVSAVAVFLSDLFSSSPLLSRGISPSTIQQVDICPTVALLLGLGIPKENVGTIIPDLFCDPKVLLQALEVNAAQLASLIQKNNLWDSPWGNSQRNQLSIARLHHALYNSTLPAGPSEGDEEFHAEKAKEAYLIFSRSVFDEFVRALERPDYYTMGVGVGMLFAAASAAVIVFVYSVFGTKPFFSQFPSIWSCLQLLISATVVLMCINWLHCSSTVTGETGTGTDSVLCKGTPIGYGLALMSALCVAACLLPVMGVQTIRYALSFPFCDPPSPLDAPRFPTVAMSSASHSHAHQHGRRPSDGSPVRRPSDADSSTTNANVAPHKLVTPKIMVGLMCIGFTLHFCSMFSSSLIEEEHRIWFFLSTTFLIILFIDALLSNDPNLSALGWISSTLLITRVIQAWNNTGAQARWSEGDIAGILVGTHFYSRAALLVCNGFAVSIMTMYTHSFTKRHVLCLGKMMGSTFELVVIIASCLVWVYHSHIGSSLAGGSSHLILARCTFCCVAMLVVMSVLWPLQRKKVQHWSSTLRVTPTLISISLLPLLLMLNRPHNMLLIILICMQAISFMHFSTADPSVTSVLPTTVLSRLCVLYSFGKCAFFALGNSNSISFIDLSGAYTGLQGYHPALVGLLAALILYTGPLMYLLASIVLLSRLASLVTRVSVTLAQGVLWHCYLITAHQATSLFLMSLIVIVFRNHLFIWSVFAPKYIYEVFHTAFQVFVFGVLSFTPRILVFVATLTAPPASP